MTLEEGQKYIHVSTHPSILVTGEGVRRLFDEHVQKIGPTTSAYIVDVTDFGATDATKLKEWHDTYNGPSKVAYISVYSIHPVAQNKLLKLLESSREGARFVFFIASVHALLPTLLSRCERVEVASHSDEVSYSHDIKNFLAQTPKERCEGDVIKDLLAKDKETNAINRERVLHFLLTLENTLLTKRMHKEAVTVRKNTELFLGPGSSPKLVMEFLSYALPKL